MSDPGQKAYQAWADHYSSFIEWSDQGPVEQAAWAAVEAAVSGGPCEAKLANIERALEIQAEYLDAMKTGINTLGAQFNQITSTVGQFAARFSSMGPAGMMKAMMGRGKPDGD